MNTTTIWGLLKDTFNDWSEDRAPRLAAALAYYAVFAIAPLLIIVIAIAGLFFGETEVRQGIVNQLGGLIGQNGGQALEAMIEGARKPTAGIIATVIGVVTLLIAASGLFGQLQDALNTIWEVQPKPNQGIWGTIRSRFLSFGMVLGIGFLLLVSLVISAALSAVGTLVIGDQYGETLLWKVVNFVVSFGVTTLLFAMIFKILPDVKIAWSDVWIGALATATLFTLGRVLISLYLGQAAPESTYGAAGSLIAILIWVYYSAQILFMGAEFTQVYARSYGSRIEPAENAVPVTEEARAQQGMPREGAVAAAAKADERPAGVAKAEDRPARTPRSGVRQPQATSSAPVADAAVGASTSAAASTMIAFVIGLLVGRRRKQHSSQP